jgi:hypothetical protein
MNQIEQQEFAETIAATIKTDIPILERVNKRLSDKLESGSGSTVSVLVPNYGRVSEGASFLSGGSANVQTLSSIEGLAVQVDKIPVKITQKKIGASWDTLEETLQFYTRTKQIKEPRISNLARHINSDVFRCVFAAAHSSIVGQIGFTDLAEAVAYVDESRIGEENSGMLSPLLNNTIAASGANKFANPDIGLELYRGTLGSWMDCEFFKSADAGNIRLGTVYAQKFALTGSVANINDGDETLTLTDIEFGGSDLAMIPAGTPIIIGSGDPAQAGSVTSPFTVSNAYGEDTQIMRTFVVLKDTPIVDGEATVPVAKINLSQNVGGALARSAAAVPNTFYSGDSAQSDLTFICPLMAGAKYALGAVFASNAIAFASAAPRPFATGESTTTELNGEVNIRTSVITDGREGQDVWRVDCLYGMSPMFGQGAVALYGLIG